MKKLLCLISGAMLLLTASSQNTDDFTRRIFLNSRLPDINLGTFINYTDSTATFSRFKNKLIILDFWFIGCTACVAQFPIEDSLQKQFDNDIQIIPVTRDSKESVTKFLKNWNEKNNTTLSLPFIVGDTVLRTLFNNAYFPHYVWIAQDRRILGYSTSQFITAENIRATLRETNEILEALKKDPGIPDRGIQAEELYNYYFKQNYQK